MLVRVVVNCGAGSVDADAQARQRADITAAFSAVQVGSDIAFVPGAELERAITAAAAAGPDAVVVAGGDGTLGTAAGVLSGGDVPLGVLPLGTFNHFAKDLGIPVDLAEAAEVVAAGHTQRVDVASVNDRCFVNNSSLGLYPVMVAVRDQIREARGWGKVRAVPVAMIRVLRRFPRHRLTIGTPDGDVLARVRTPFVFVGNNHYETGGGGPTRHRLDGGELVLAVADARTRGAMVRTAVSILLRGASAAPGVEEYRGTEFTITAHDHSLRVAVDGEVLTMRSPLRYRMRPGALAVLAPDPSDAGQG